jgi:hypothetical protein
VSCPLARERLFSYPGAMRTTALAKLSSVSLAFAAAWLARPAPALACSCYVSVAEDGRATSAEVVFQGTVMAEPEPESVDPLNNYVYSYRYQLRVDRYFKGRMGRDLEIISEESGAGCGYPFESGRSYLVYADFADDGSLGVSLCSITRPLESAGQALALLGNGVPPEGVSQEVVVATEQDQGCSIAALGASGGRLASVSSALLLGAALLRRRRRHPG